jgi:uncharacterized protein with ATP-grasp and redox domains
MKAKPDCIVCMFKQGLNTVRLVTDDTDTHLRVLSELGRHATDICINQTPAALSQPAYEIVAELTGIADPFNKLKKEANTTALTMLDSLRAMIRSTDAPLARALHIAVAGNVIDLGILGHDLDIKADVESILNQDFAVNAIEDFRKELTAGRKLLYLGDNAGEIVFDSLLIEQLLEKEMEVVFTVKSGPIINDATMEDAEATGMTKLVKVIETGSNDIGVNWNNASDEFRAAFESADVVLGKGHGNFETCNDRRENIYFLLKAKCEMVAAELGVELGDIVFKHN